ncbi:glycosyltransferase family 4 protein [Candidatus Uhrbacteria bacterium]|nr:glycosyltransferase family 4 protein [Candidatus Uhrbacteria bacterium]
MAKPFLMQVIWSLERGGAERMVLDVSTRLKEDFHVEVMALGRGRAMISDFREAGIPLHIAPESTPGFGRKVLFEFISKIVAKRKPDIWHTHLGGDIWGGHAARRLNLRPWFITAHSHEPGLNFITRIARWRSYRTADHVVCISESVRKAIAGQYGVRADRMSIIPVGIDPARFPPRDAHLAGDRPRLVSVGRLSPEKGHAMLFEALAMLRRPWELVLVGDGPERTALHRRAEMLGILPRIRFVGSVADPSPFLRDADLFVFPSKHEGQGIALLEAAAARLPALVSDLPIFHEAFNDESLVFAPPENAQAWAASIEDCLSNYQLLLPKAERARRIVLEKFTIDKTAEAYADLYKTWLK